MDETRIRWRGGKDSIAVEEMLAVAFEDGEYARAFPAFGVERHGAQAALFAPIGNSPVCIHSQINSPDYVIVQDSMPADLQIHY